ncbi:MAG: dynamin family protein [Candidatus Bathyarchaeota archaeon]|nr:dynamin family protein [Candidatus Bathyarchaeota archaeon]
MSAGVSSLDYSHQRAEIEKTGHAILKVAEQTNNTAIASFISDVLDNLSREEYYVAIFGLSNRGKSTLINAILGQSIIPTGVNPAKSVITRIRYGTNLNAKIRFSDGKEKAVPVKALYDFITEEKNPNNKKSLAVADIFMPTPILKDGIILIDTPEVDSTHLDVTTTTFRFLDRADVVLFVLAGHLQVGQQELELIGNLASKSNKILFVLNTVDDVEPAAVNESVMYCQRVISKQLGYGNGSSLVIYPVSAELALDGQLHNSPAQVESSGIKQLEAAIKETLLAQKENAVLKSVWKKLEGAAADLKTHVEVELNALTMPSDNLTHLLLEFEQYLIEVNQKKLEIFYALEGCVKEIVSMLDEDLTAFENEHESALVKQIQDFAEHRLMPEKTISRTVVNEVDTFYKTRLREVYSEFIRNEDIRVESRFRQLVEQANGKTNTLIGAIKRKAKQLFGSQTTDSIFSVSLDFETRFYYPLDSIFFDPFTYGIDANTQLLSKSWLNGNSKVNLADQVRAEFFKNREKACFNYFVSRINRAVLMLRNDICRALKSSTETVKKAVYKAQELRTKNETEVFSAIIILNRLLGHLQLAQVQAIRKQVGRDYELFREKPPTGL